MILSPLPSVNVSDFRGESILGKVTGSCYKIVESEYASNNGEVIELAVTVSIPFVVEANLPEVIHKWLATLKSFLRPEMSDKQLHDGCLNIQSTTSLLSKTK